MRMASALEVKRRHEDRLMATPGVVGVAVGARDGRECILVFVDADRPAIRKAVPRVLEDVDVEIVESGTFTARKDA